MLNNISNIYKKKRELGGLLAGIQPINTVAFFHSID